MKIIKGKSNNNMTQRINKFEMRNIRVIDGVSGIFRKNSYGK